MELMPRKVYLLDEIHSEPGFGKAKNKQID